MRVIRDRTTKALRAMWEAAGNEPTPDPEPEEEFVILPNMTVESVLAVAEMKAGGRPGRIYVHDERVEAEKPEEPEPTQLLRELVRLRELAGKRDDEPLTFGDIRNIAEGRAKKR